jgi:hypothetical protein
MVVAGFFGISSGGGDTAVSVGCGLLRSMGVFFRFAMITVYNFAVKSKKPPFFALGGSGNGNLRYFISPL